MQKTSQSPQYDCGTYHHKLTTKSLNRHKFATRTSKYYCEERLACKGTKPEAHYKCNDCGTHQCNVCEELVHEKSKFVFHERVRLTLPSPLNLCQNKCENCNYSDIRCDDCDKNLCFACDSIIHNPVSKRKHSRRPIKCNGETESEDEEFISAPLFVDNDRNQIVDPLITVDLDSDSDNGSGDSMAKSPKRRDKSNVGKSLAPSDATSCQTYNNTLNNTLPDIAQLTLEMSFDGPVHSPITTTSTGINMTTIGVSSSNSFLLIDEHELLQVSNSDEFALKLGCSPSSLIKVVSIFGNTGEGKSHTLNYTFFNGYELFKTSPAQSSCTIGIWCSYDPKCRIIAIDTEGLLGISENNNRRTRLLLKVLAISDIVIYRTRAERLHNDLFTFLGDASRAYVSHFSKELKAASLRCNLSCPLSDLGPIVVIFHETLHTEVLRTENDLTPEDIIRQRFQKLGLSTEAFSAVEYVGTRTIAPPTYFKGLQDAVTEHLKNSTVRSARTSTVVFTALKVLNEKFSGGIDACVPSTFPDEYFTCSSHCSSCNARCVNSMNHLRDRTPHIALIKCKYQHQFDNQVFYCRKCNDGGDDSLVVPKTSSANDYTWLGIAKYAWSGYVLECKTCGIIYRSRQYWYGNKDPIEQSVVRTEILHVWEGEMNPTHGSQNAAQRMVDSVNYLTGTVSNIGAKPTKMLSNWFADQIAPSYWVPNARILHCGNCRTEFGPFDPKHHCRACGGGFCENCSSKSRPVPERGWGDHPVRVCDRCFERAERSPELTAPEVTARRVGEVLQTTIGSVVSAIDYPLEWIKESARPEYWIPDKDITECYICKCEFSEKVPIHHCRSCGYGICDGCSLTRRSVPERGWDQPVRVCDNCTEQQPLH